MDWILITCLLHFDGCKRDGSLSTTFVTEQQCRGALSLSRYGIQALCLTPTGEIISSSDKAGLK